MRDARWIGVITLVIWVVVLIEVRFSSRGWPQSIGWAVIALGAGSMGLVIGAPLGAVIGFGAFVVIAATNWRKWHLPQKREM